VAWIESRRVGAGARHVVRVLSRAVRRGPFTGGPEHPLRRGDPAGAAGAALQPSDPEGACTLYRSGGQRA